MKIIRVVSEDACNMEEAEETEKEGKAVASLMETITLHYNCANLNVKKNLTTAMLKA